MQFIRAKIIQPLAEMPPFQKVLVVTVGTLGGIVPIPAVTSAVTVGLGAVTRLSPQGIAVSTALNLALTPMQFVFFVPFAQLGKAMLGTFLTVLLGFAPPANNAQSTVGSSPANGDSSWYWDSVRSLSQTVDAMVPSLTAITESNGLGEIVANSGAMLAIGTFAWSIVAAATLGGAYGVVKPLLSRGGAKATAKKASLKKE